MPFIYHGGFFIENQKMLRKNVGWQKSYLLIILTIEVVVLFVGTLVHKWPHLLAAGLVRNGFMSTVIPVFQGKLG